MHACTLQFYKYSTFVIQVIERVNGAHLKKFHDNQGSDNDDEVQVYVSSELLYLFTLYSCTQDARTTSAPVDASTDGTISSPNQKSLVSIICTCIIVCLHEHLSTPFLFRLHHLHFYLTAHILSWISFLLFHLRCNHHL